VWDTKNERGVLPFWEALKLKVFDQRFARVNAGGRIGRREMKIERYANVAGL
jgi:hypothetical protein